MLKSHTTGTSLIISSHFIHTKVNPCTLKSFATIVQVLRRLQPTATLNPLLLRYLDAITEPSPVSVRIVADYVAPPAAIVKTLPTPASHHFTFILKAAILTARAPDKVKAYASTLGASSSCNW
jgi:hypothetical protein